MQPASQKAATPIRDAASILVVNRQAQDGPSILMGQRGKSAAFMPSKYVFPGGAVDPEDAGVLLGGQLSAQSHDRLMMEPRNDVPTAPRAIAAAALRELVEETGLIAGRPGTPPPTWPKYGAAGLVPDPSGLIYFFRAITPPRLSRRFDARFLLLDANRLHGDITDFSAAGDELSHLHWVPIDQARKLDLPFITEIVLAELARLLQDCANAPLVDPARVPFFDNRTDQPRFAHIT